MISPAENHHLIGHNLQKSHFLDAFHSDRFPHGWIFSGQRGIGKATFAYTMARYLLSGRQDKNTAFSPDEPLFRRMTARSHGDFLVLERDEGKQEITVDQARKIPAFFSQTSAEGGWRVVIIDEADRMNRSTMNGILKSLEEPPELTALFLITQSMGRLLPTITSRCQTMKFSPLPHDQMLEVINHMDLNLPGAQKETLVDYSDGSPGRFLEFVDEATLAHQLSQLLEQVPWMSLEPMVPLINRGAEDEKVFDILEHMTLQALHRSVEKNVRGESAPLPLEQSLAVWEKITELFQDCRQAQLDRRATLFAVFSSLEKEHI